MDWPQVCNHTRKVVQEAATCGPWSLWICFAYVFNYKRCRSPDDDAIAYASLQDDALDFWSEITY